MTYYSLLIGINLFIASYGIIIKAVDYYLDLKRDKLDDYYENLFQEKSLEYEYRLFMGWKVERKVVQPNNILQPSSTFRNLTKEHQLAMAQYNALIDAQRMAHIQNENVLRASSARGYSASVLSGIGGLFV